MLSEIWIQCYEDFKSGYLDMLGTMAFCGNAIHILTP